MKILLLGEYSNLHNTLAQALRSLGHEVLLVSNGDGWKNYPRDIDLTRPTGRFSSLRYGLRLLRLLPRMRGYDVVQIINPIFLDLKAQWNKRIFDYLRHHNRCVSVGCFGDDYFIVRHMQDDKILEYSDFYAGAPIRHTLNDQRIATWLSPEREGLCRHIARHAHCLAACLYEYYMVYNHIGYADKLFYAPLPVVSKQDTIPKTMAYPVRVLLGVQKKRGAMKGTDRIQPLLERLAAEHPKEIILTRVESVPFSQYKLLIEQTDVLVDQLYSYTPAMNALEAMRHGTIVISGGEEKAYRFIQEDEWRPIINLHPAKPEENYQILKSTLLNLPLLASLSQQSICFIRKHHDAGIVAEQYLKNWRRALEKT